MRVVFAVAAALTIILGACTGSADTADIDDPESDVAADIGDLESDIAAGASGAAAGDPGESLPFDAVLIELFGTSDLDAYQSELDARAAEVVAECMRAAGFEFTLPEAPLPPPEAADLGTLDYAATDGFGLIVGFRQTIARAGLGAGDIDDVNRDYLQSLSADEIDRFFVALQGEPAAPGQLPSDRGCQGIGNDQIFGAWQRFNESLPQFAGMAEERDSRPDWLAARAEWQACMLAKGFDYNEPEEIRTDVALRMEDLILGGQEEFVVDTADGIILDPEVDELLDEMLSFERDAAVANFVCNEPLQSRFEAVEREVQQGFVDRNRLAIEELLAFG